VTPSLTQVRAWDTQHLTEAAEQWTASANTWEHTFTQYTHHVGSPGGAPWDGAAAEAAQQRAQSDRIIVVGFVDQLHDAVAAANAGATQIQAARTAALQAVADAQADGFTVGDDFSVSSHDSGSWDYLSARQAKAELHAQTIRKAVTELVATDTRVATHVHDAAAGLDAVKFVESGGVGVPEAPAPEQPPAPPQAGQPVPPGTPFVGDENFGHWENLPTPPPYVGAKPPPLASQYRPFPDGTPEKLGGTTGMYTPGKNWITDDQAPAAQLQEAYRFRIAGNEATTYTRMVNENGRWQQQRWVANVYEYQRNTQVLFGGSDVAKMHDGSGTGDLGGLGPFVNIDHDWKPISLHQIAGLSAKNFDITYYLPDGCGGQVTFEGGVVPRVPGAPVPIPVMTAAP